MGVFWGVSLSWTVVSKVEDNEQYKVLFIGGKKFSQESNSLASAKGSVDLNAEPIFEPAVVDDSVSHLASTSGKSVQESNNLDILNKRDTLGSIIAGDISNQLDIIFDDEKYDFAGEELGKFDLLFGLDVSDPERVVVGKTVGEVVEKLVCLLDVNNAFLYGELVEDVYMSQLERYFTLGDQRVCKLKKSLYGLKHAPRKWNKKLSCVLCDLGISQSKNDHSLFVNVAETEKFKQLFSNKFMIKDLGELKYVLGIEVIDIKENEKIEAKSEQNQARNEKHGKVNQVKVKPVKTGHGFGKSTKNQSRRHKYLIGPT
nr:ribonuclease H-like domain-containing protein [Tanacetum cinerariifolium]